MTASCNTDGLRCMNLSTTVRTLLDNRQPPEKEFAVGRFTDKEAKVQETIVSVMYNRTKRVFGGCFRKYGRRLKVKPYHSCE